MQSYGGYLEICKRGKLPLIHTPYTIFTTYLKLRNDGHVQSNIHGKCNLDILLATLKTAKSHSAKKKLFGREGLPVGGGGRGYSTIPLLQISPGVVLSLGITVCNLSTVSNKSLTLVTSCDFHDLHGDSSETIILSQM